MKLDWRPVPVVKGGEIKISSSITRRETDCLMRLANGQVVAEIGTAFGYSAIAMALGGASLVVTADPHEAMNSWEVSRRNVDDYGVAHKVERHKGRAVDVFAGQADAYGLVFVDGDHGYGAVQLDCVLASKLVEPHGTIVFHDYGEVTSPDVAVALNEYWANGPDRLVDTLWIKRMRE